MWITVGMTARPADLLWWWWEAVAGFGDQEDKYYVLQEAYTSHGKQWHICCMWHAEKLLAIQHFVSKKHFDIRRITNKKLISIYVGAWHNFFPKP